MGVWAGNANGEEARQLTGTQTAAPLMLDTFNYLSYSQWPEAPLYALKQYTVCKNDHYLSANACATELATAPIEADFNKISPYHQLIHIDKHSRLRVHGYCESPSNMLAISHFTIPAVHAFYYQQDLGNIAWREDCLDNLPAVNAQLPLDLEYPAQGARIKIPVELDGQLGRVIIKARHHKNSATIFWHLNNRYIDNTKHIHEQAIAVNPDWHQITLVDDKGYTLTRWFEAI